MQFSGYLPINKEIIFLVKDSSEGGYEAKAIGYSIYTEADTMNELHIMLKDSIECHFGDKEQPEIIHLSV